MVFSLPTLVKWERKSCHKFDINLYQEDILLLLMMQAKPNLLQDILPPSTTYEDVRLLIIF